MSLFQSHGSVINQARYFILLKGKVGFFVLLQYVQNINVRIHSCRMVKYNDTM